MSPSEYGCRVVVPKSEVEDRSLFARRLGIAVATPLIALILVGVLLIQQILKMAEDADWVTHTIQVIAVANETKLGIIDQETGLRGYIINGDQLFLETFERARPLDGFERLHALVADNPAQQARFGEARQRYEAWLASALKVIEGGDLADARASESMRDRKRHMDAIREAMREAIKVEEQLQATRVATSQASGAMTKRILIGVLAVVALLLGVLSRRQLDSIATTFRAALDAQRAANAAMEKEMWIRQGQAKLSDALQGDKTTAQVGRSGLATLADYIGADVGAFFVRRDGKWLRCAGVALDSRVAGPETFDEGEGIVGRAAADGRLLDLREVPPDFLKLRSGTGEVAPSQVVVIPATVDGQAQAVIELGFLRPANARTTELLSRVGESVALAVRSSEYKARLRDLLEETQRQGEELQTQQEELKVQNEELEQQTRALQDAQVRMEGQQTELEQINSQLEEQSQALERQRDDLAQSQGELQRANTYKSEFLANMSHELRTPLNSSLILAKLLSDNRHGHLDEEEVKFARTIYSAGNDLLTLINDILDLSKIEAGKLDVRPEEVALPRLLDDLAATFRPVAEQKRLELGLSLEPQAPRGLHTDPVRLQQILKNLLSNALKFTERGGVTLTVSGSAEGTVSFAVQDTGIGIAPDQQEVVFEAFRQADGTTNRKYGGTGLGLSISRDLARLLGGQLLLRSEVGRGSTFELVLPPRFQGGDGPTIAPLQRPTAVGRVTSTPTEASRPAVRQAGPAKTATSAAAPDDREQLVAGARAILIIEDDLRFALTLRDLARELQFAALIAQTGDEGLEMARTYRPSGILLDVGLPDRSGLSVLDTLKHDAATRHIPVHVMSGSDHAQAALEMGATGYEIKPVAHEQLARALQRIESKITQSLRRVLVVEDDHTHRDSTCRLLAGPGVEIVGVGAAKEALEQLTERTFDCMVLDLSLPDRTGFELLEEMASKEQFAFPPVIVYTGRSLSRDEEQQLRKFSQSIIIKGARSPERLLDAVTLFLHQVEADLPPERQRMLREARNRDAVFEGRRILIVEDDVRNVFALKSVLEPRGAKTEIARNGKEALAHLRDKPGVDLVLMDIMMPEMDGLTAMREIRKQAQYAKLPIIALTAKAMSDDRESCLAAGASDYIAKPLDVDKLLSLARVWMPK